MKSNQYMHRTKNYREHKIMIKNRHKKITIKLCVADRRPHHTPRPPSIRRRRRRWQQKGWLCHKTHPFLSWRQRDPRSGWRCPTQAPRSGWKTRLPPKRPTPPRRYRRLHAQWSMARLQTMGRHRVGSGPHLQLEKMKGPLQHQVRPVIHRRQRRLHRIMPHQNIPGKK